MTKIDSKVNYFTLLSFVLAMLFQGLNVMKNKVQQMLPVLNCYLMCNNWNGIQST